MLWALTLASGRRVEAIAVPTFRACSLVFHVEGRVRRVIDCDSLADALAHAAAVERRLASRFRPRVRADEA